MQNRICRPAQGRKYAGRGHPALPFGPFCMAEWAVWHGRMGRFVKPDGPFGIMIRPVWRGWNWWFCMAVWPCCRIAMPCRGHHTAWLRRQRALCQGVGRCCARVAYLRPWAPSCRTGRSHDACCKIKSSRGKGCATVGAVGRAMLRGAKVSIGCPHPLPLG